MRDYDVGSHLEPNHFIDPLRFSVRREISDEEDMHEEDCKRFSDDLDKIKFCLEKTKALESSELVKITSYYIALYQCVEFVRIDKSKIVRMKMNFQDMSKLISVNLDRLEKRIGVAPLNEVKSVSEGLIKYLSDAFIRAGTGITD